MKTIKLSSMININIYILFIHIISGTIFSFLVRYDFRYGFGSVPVRLLTNLQYRTKLVKRSGSIRLGVKTNQFGTVFYLSVRIFGWIFSPSHAQP